MADPDRGKSTVTLDLSARVTTHSPMARWQPVGPTGVRGGHHLVGRGRAAGDTIRPRADAARADVNLIHLLTDVEALDDKGRSKRLPWMLPRDLDVLRVLIETSGARLVVVDPLNAFLESPRRQLSRSGHARRTAAARRHSRVGLALRSSSSGTYRRAAGNNALYRGGGSIGIIGAVRSGLLVALDPDDETGGRRCSRRTSTT